MSGGKSNFSSGKGSKGHSESKSQGFLTEDYSENEATFLMNEMDNSSGDLNDFNFTIRDSEILPVQPKSGRTACIRKQPMGNKQSPKERYRKMPRPQSKGRAGLIKLTDIILSGREVDEEWNNVTTYIKKNPKQVHVLVAKIKAYSEEMERRDVHRNTLYEAFVRRYLGVLPVDVVQETVNMLNRFEDNTRPQNLFNQSMIHTAGDYHRIEKIAELGPKQEDREVAEPSKPFEIIKNTYNDQNLDICVR